MPAIKLEQFGGMLPAWDSHLLPPGQASYSKNGYLFSGALAGWRKPKILRTLLNSSTRFMYRIPTVSETQALAYQVFITQPTAGDKTVIGDLTYTFVASLPSGGNPQDVLIGADVTATATNFANAISADNALNTNAGVQYGKNTVTNGEVKWYIPNTELEVGLQGPSVGAAAIGATTYTYVVVGAVDFGASFNLVKVSETTANARVSWLSDLLSLAHTTTTFAGGSNPSFSNVISGAATWMEFDDPDTNVIRSPIVNDQWNRFYFASPSRMPEYNTYDRVVAGQPPWLLGIPPPGCAPTLQVDGGGNPLTLGNFAAGNATSGDGPFNGLANTIYLTKITLPGHSHILAMNFGAVNADPQAGWGFALYKDNNGAPGALFHVSNDNIGTIFAMIHQGIVAGTNRIEFPNQPALTDTNYWIGLALFARPATILGGAGASSTISATPTSSFTFVGSNGYPLNAPAATAGLPSINIWAEFGDTVDANGQALDVLESRAYVYTWVSAYGEESAPSPPTLLDGWSNATWTLGLWQPPPNDLGILRNLKKINIYRTVSGAGGATVFFFVATVDIGTASYVDNIHNNTVALNDQLASTTWFPPPENLQGIVVLPNGMMAGFIGQEVWFCEQYRPHAWPPGYVITVDFPIVGLGVTNSALVICTNATPYVVTGNTPAAMSQFKCSHAHPCSSRASILGGDDAVSYMSPNGLIQVNQVGQATNTTDLWFTRENWQQLTPPRYARAIRLGSCYYCLGSVSPAPVTPVDTSQAQRGFTIELDQDNASFTIWPQPGGHRLGFNLLDSPTGFDVKGLMTDPWAGTGLVISNGSLWYFDFSDAAPEMISYTWKSKLYQQNAKRNYSAMKVFFTVPTNTPAQNTSRLDKAASDSAWATFPTDRYGFIKTYVDVDGTGNLTLIDAREIRASGELLRIVDGFKCDTWQWQIEGRVLISNVQIATSVKELAGV